MSPNPNGLIDVPSGFSVNETLAKFQAVLIAANLTIFAMVDHSGEAEKVGMHMKPTKLVIFGNPKGGTPVMLAAPSAAIDLPLKVLIWEDARGKVWCTYNSPEYLQQRHGVPMELVKNISGVGALVQKALE